MHWSQYGLHTLKLAIQILAYSAEVKDWLQASVRNINLHINLPPVSLVLICLSNLKPTCFILYLNLVRSLKLSVLRIFKVYNQNSTLNSNTSDNHCKQTRYSFSRGSFPNSGHLNDSRKRQFLCCEFSLLQVLSAPFLSKTRSNVDFCSKLIITQLFLATQSSIKFGLSQ